MPKARAVHAVKASTEHTSPTPERGRRDLLSPSVRTIDEHSGGTRKTSTQHATAVVNDVRGHNQGEAGREPTSGCELIFTKRTFHKHQELTHNMYPLFNQAMQPEENTTTVNKELPGTRARERGVQFQMWPAQGSSLATTAHGSDLRIPQNHHVEKCGKPSISTQKLTQTMCPLSNQAPSPPISHHRIVEELILRHLHSYVSQGGCHWECCVSMFFQNEPSWPLSSTNSVRS